MAIPPGAGRRAAVPRQRPKPKPKPVPKNVGRGVGRKPVPRPRPRPGTTRTTTTKKTTTSQSSSVGFDAKQMAQTLTDLGYDAQIAEIERAIQENARREMQAMSNLTDWSNQVEDFRSGAAGSVRDVWNSAIAGNAASDANIANLFGENAAGEAAAGMAPGQEMLQALGASDQSFLSYMQPILAQQGVDYKNRARGEFGAERSELLGQARDLHTEKSKAYGENLLNMMQLGWDREQQIYERKQGESKDAFDRRMAMLQAKQAQQALNQSAKMFGPELQAQKISNKAAAQSIKMNAQAAANDAKLAPIQRQQAKIANRKALAELKALENQGVDLLDPQASMQVAQAAMAGGLNKNGVIMMNPRLALRTAMDVLAAMGLSQNPEAITAVMKAFEISLRFSHSKGAWQKWGMKNGQLVYNTKGKGQNTGVQINPKNPQITLPNPIHFDK